MSPCTAYLPYRIVSSCSSHLAFHLEVEVGVRKVSVAPTTSTSRSTSWYSYISTNTPPSCQPVLARRWWSQEWKWGFSWRCRWSRGCGVWACWLFSVFCFPLANCWLPACLPLHGDAGDGGWVGGAGGWWIYSRVSIAFSVIIQRHCSLLLRWQLQWCIICSVI